MVLLDGDLVLNKLCRCCMCENENMYNMFEPKDPDEADVALAEMLRICAAVEVDSADSLPNQLCAPCEEKLKNCYEFRKQCQQTDITLRELAQIETKKLDELLATVEDQFESKCDDTFDEEDNIPLLARKDIKRKRGRPRKLEPDPEIISFPCTVCSKVLSSRKGLKVHLQTHSEDKSLQCLFCDAKYIRPNHLFRHLSSHDKEGLKHECQKCEDTFEAAIELFKHQQLHQLDKPESTVEDHAKDEVPALKTESPESLVPQELIETPLTENLPTAAYPEDGEPEQDDVFQENSFSDDADNAFDANSDGEDEFVSEERPVNEENDGENEEDKPKAKRGRRKKGAEEVKILYKCKECSKVMTSLIGYRLHMKNCGFLETCKLCNKEFPKRRQFVKHMKLHGITVEEHENEIKDDKRKSNQVMECDYCDRKFKYKKSFNHHMQTEHGMSDEDSEVDKTGADEDEANKVLNDGLEGDDQQNVDISADIKMEGQNSLMDGQNAMVELEEADLSLEPDSENVATKKQRSKNQVCHVCGASFARVNHLTRHMILHRAVLTHQCDRCEKAFASEVYLKQHVEEEHINKPYVCTICNKPFSRGEHLIRHLKVHQMTPEKEASLKCSICDTTFSRSDHLARHTKVHLLLDKRHVCTECGKAFNRLDNLKTHQRVHTGVKDTSKLHLCIYCGKEFNNSSNMIVHMRRHTGERPYKCNECGKGFPRSHDLKCHERTHSGEKPYLCTLCGKSFNKSNKLLRHSRVHTGERPYVCNICGRAFTQSNDLALHMRRHTGARPYACGICPARFIQSGQLKSHRRTTGHWMETQPDLKGGHRVEPVTPAHEPMPIRFKSHGINKLLKKEEPVDLPKPNEPPQPQEQQYQLPEQAPVVIDLQPSSRMVMSLVGNIRLQNEVSPLLIDSSKLVELHQVGLVNIPAVIQAGNGEEIKLKSEVAGLAIMQDSMEKHEEDGNGAYQDATVIYSSVDHTATTYTSSETYSFQNYH